MGDWHFQYPWLFLLLPLLAWCMRRCPPRAVRVLFPHAEELARMASVPQRAREILKWIALIALVTALASPVKEERLQNVTDRGYEIALILDASGSMAQNGKFDVVKGIVERFVKERRHDRIGLTIFADFAYVAVPLTYDKEALLRLLSKVEVGIAGTRRTALYEALFMSMRLFKRSRAKDKIAILLTDGMDNAGTVPLQVAINAAKRYGVRVYTVGVGRRGDYNPLVLRRIAEETGGRFFEADTVGELREVYRTIDRLEKSEFKAKKFLKRTYGFVYPLAAALAAMTLLFLLRFGRFGGVVR